MKTNVLIIGGSGLLAINWAVAIRDRYSVTLGLHSRDISINGVESQKIDLESINELEREFERVKPQIVIHTSGLTSVEKCESNEKYAHHVNVELAVNVAQVCEKNKITMVHISTDHLFSGGDEMVDEIYPVNPINVYGRTKAEAESKVLEIYPQALVIRTNFFGWGTSYRSSFSDVIIQSLQAGRKIILYQDVFYTPVLVEIVAQAVHDLIKLKASGIYHVVGDERISKYEFGLKLAHEFDLDANLIIAGSIIDNPSLVQRPFDMSLSNKKTCKLLARKLGNVEDYITRLHEQEKYGIAQDLQKL